MRISWGCGWHASWASDMVLFAWLVTALYVFGSALFTNGIKRREGFRNRLLDSALLYGGYFLMFSQVPFSESLLLPARKPLQMAGVVLAYAGLPLTIWSRARLGRYWSGVVALKHDHRLIQSGPYRLVRHPLYSGLILGAVGWGLCVTTWTSLLGVLSLVTCLERRAYKEDAFLASEFGAEFEAYRQRTGRLIPRLN
jgi:protein-S-isoprenylcysteine O-methyltransferase Ste14